MRPSPRRVSIYCSCPPSVFRPSTRAKSGWPGRSVADPAGAAAARVRDHPAGPARPSPDRGADRAVARYARPAHAGHRAQRGRHPAGPDGWNGPEEAAASPAQGPSSNGPGPGLGKLCRAAKAQGEAAGTGMPTRPDGPDLTSIRPFDTVARQSFGIVVCGNGALPTSVIWASTPPATLLGCGEVRCIAVTPTSPPGERRRGTCRAGGRSGH